MPVSRRELKSYANAICILCMIVPVYLSADMSLNDEESTHLSLCLLKSIRSSISVLSPSLTVLRYEIIYRLIKFPNPILEHYNLKCVCFWRNSSQWARASSFTRFLDHTQRRTTVGRTPLYEWSARRRDLYLTTHNTHNRHPCLRRDFYPKSQQTNARRPTP